MILTEFLPTPDTNEPMPRPYLILPVENQVRELDAKILLACVAAQRGFSSIIGWRGLIDARVGRFPPSVYLAKSMSRENTKMFRINRKLGHTVIAWDEEAVVHYPAQIYYARRIGTEALKLIDVFIAWGEDNRELLQAHPNFDTKDIRVLGNPRADLLRHDMCSYFDQDAAAITREHGDFILVNTNFGSVNGYADRLNLVRSHGGNASESPLGRGASGMPPDYARGLFDYRRQVIQAFAELVPKIAQAFPDTAVILRPHPAENHAYWRNKFADSANVHITAEGNVIPWLLAARCLVHNGCTTAVEGSLLGTPIISFVPIDDPRYEFELPNKLGDRAVSADAVIEHIAAAYDDTQPRCTSPQAHALLSRFIRPMDETLAAHKIVDVISERIQLARPTRVSNRLPGIARAEFRSATKRIQTLAGVAQYSRGFVRQRFPEISLTKMQDKADRLTKLINGKHALVVSAREPDLFEINKR